MSHDDKKALLPASSADLQDSLAYALRFAGRKRVHQARGENLLVVLLPDEADDAFGGEQARLATDFGGRAYLALTLRRRPGDGTRLTALSAMATAAGVAPVVLGDVLYHAPERRILQDVVTCIRDGCNRRRGLPARALCRPAPAGAARDGPPLRRPFGCPGRAVLTVSPG